MKKGRNFAIAFFLLSLQIVLSGLVCVSARAVDEAPSGIIIDEISLLGVTIFAQTDIEKILEISPGDKLDRKKIIQTATNIRDLYHTHGYEEVKVRSDLVRRSTGVGKKSENVVEININEGRPARIAEIVMVYDDPKVGEKLRTLESRIGLAFGDVLDREKLANGYRTFQDSLSTRDYMGAKVEDAIETKVAQPPYAPDSKAPIAASWVKLSIKVSLGEKVTFGYQGNQIFTAQQLNAWIEEQRLLGYSADYIQRIEDRIIDEYRKLGYEHTSIQTFTFENTDTHRHVTLKITEGPRVQVKQIRFDGNVAFQTDDLLEQFENASSSVLARGYYVAKDAENASSLVAEWMRSKGYLTSKVISVNKEYVRGNDQVILTIFLYEGEQTLVQNIDFIGLKLFPFKEVKETLGIQENAPLNLYALSEGLEVLKAKYRAKGHLDFQITNEGKNDLVVYESDNRLADITLRLSEGVQYHVSRIEITGQSKTKAYVVLRELRLKEGDILEEPKWFESEVRLRRLALFSSVSIKAFEDPNDKKGKILKVQLEEGTPGLLAGGFGLRNDIGGRVFGQVAYSNLFGRNHTLSLTAAANRRFRGFGSDFCASDVQKAADPSQDHCFIEFNTQLAYAWPWALLGETTFRPSLSYERTQYKNFDANTVALQLMLQRMLVPRWNLAGALTYSLERTEQYNAILGNASDQGTLRIGALVATLILDRRDSQLAPSKGTYTTGSFELARPEFLSQRDPFPVAYGKFQFRHDQYIPFPKDMSLFLSFRSGLVYNYSRAPDDLTGSDRERYSVPLIKQFALGGVGSLRGYRELSITTPNDVLAGYATYVNYRLQFDFPFSGAMRMGPFVDALNLNVDRYSLGNLKYGVGFGFHYRSPIGPVNFDIGINPKPEMVRTGNTVVKEDSYRIHFSIGNL